MSPLFNAFDVESMTGRKLLRSLYFSYFSNRHAESTFRGTLSPKWMNALQNLPQDEIEKAFLKVKVKFDFQFASEEKIFAIFRAPRPAFSEIFV